MAAKRSADTLSTEFAHTHVRNMVKKMTPRFVQFIKLVSDFGIQSDFPASRGDG